MPTLPDVKAKFVVDYSDLSKAEKASAKAHGEFQAGAKTSTTHMLRFEQSLTTLMDHFGGLPPVANEAGRSLESMASQGVTGMALLGGAALVAVGVIAEVVGQGVKAYVTLGESIENYKRVVGSSAEESSRMVETFQLLGVGADVAEQGMFKLSKAIETTPKKLEDLGVAIARDSKGNVDLAKTLGNVADAYNALADPAKKNLLLFDAFGRSGKDMIPILEKGSAALKAYEDSAGMVFTQGDLDRLKQYKIDQAELSQNFEEFKAGIGQNVLPMLDELARDLNRVTEAQHIMDDSMRAGIQTQQALEFSHGQGQRAAEAQADANYKLKQGMDAATQAAKEQSAAEAENTKEIDANLKAVEELTSGEFKLDAAKGRAFLSQAAINDAEAKRDADRKQYGASSLKAMQDEVALTAAVDAQRQAYLDIASEEVKADAAKQHLTGTDMTATEKVDDQIKQLQAEAKTLSPDSDLYKWLMGYIDQLNNIPRDKYTYLHLDQVTGAHGGGGAAQRFAEGGRPPVGVASWIGEHGKELWVPDQPGTIIPNPAAMANQTAMAGSNTYNYNLSLNGSAAVDDPEGVRRMLQRMSLMGAAS